VFSKGTLVYYLVVACALFAAFGASTMSDGH
jgi:hypothetical protein